MLKLVLGDRNYSSWSLRPWLAAKQAGIAFEEIPIHLHGPNARADIQRYSPSGKIPCLLDGETVIWDSLAICEYLAEQAPILWPSERKLRAEARSIAAEMHSGFTALRQNLPMDIRASKRFANHPAEVQADIARVIEIWESCRRRFAARGHFLFGNFSVADAMFAPLVWRFLSYAVALPDASRAWSDTMVALPAMQEWRTIALAEQAAK